MRQRDRIDRIFSEKLEGQKQKQTDKQRNTKTETYTPKEKESKVEKRVEKRHIPSRKRQQSRRKRERAQTRTHPNLTAGAEDVPVGPVGVHDHHSMVVPLAALHTRLWQASRG